MAENPIPRYLVLSDSEEEEIRIKKAQLEIEIKTCEFINILRGMFPEDIVRAIAFWELYDPRVRVITRSMVGQSELARFAILFDYSCTMPNETRQVIAKAFDELSRRQTSVPVFRPAPAPQSVPTDASGLINFTSRCQHYTHVENNEIPYRPWGDRVETGDLELFFSEVELELPSFFVQPVRITIHYTNIPCVVELRRLVDLKQGMSRYQLAVPSVIFSSTKKPARGSGSCSYHLSSQCGKPLFYGSFRIVSALTLKSRAKRA